MDNERMLEAIGGIDPAFVREAEPKARPRFLRYAGAAAAGVLLVLGLGLMLPKLLKPSSDVVNDNELTYAEGYADPNFQPRASDGLFPEAEGTVVFVPSPEPVTDQMRAALEELVSRADVIAVARCQGCAEDSDDSPAYTPVEALKGTLPDPFFVENAVTAAGGARYLLFLSEPGGQGGAYFRIASFYEDGEAHGSSDVPEECAFMEFETAVDAVKDIIDND